ncbi:hypothetical protein LCGC14_1976700, partial [marine sediment metagenome]
LGNRRASHLVTQAFGGFKVGGKTSRRQSASVANKLTLRMNSAAIGISKGQITGEAALLFAPRYYRAFFGLLGDALQGGMRGAEARRSLGQMAAGFLAMNVALEMIPGVEPLQLDPRKPNYFTTKIGGLRVGPGGPFVSLFSLLGKATKRDREGEFLVDLPFGLGVNPGLAKLDFADNPLMRWGRGKMSPVASLVFDVLKGETFMYDKLENPMDYATLLSDRLTPFFVQAGIDAYTKDLSLKDTATAMGLEFATGARTWPESAFDVRAAARDRAAQDKYGKGYGDLTKDQRSWVNENDKEVIEANNAAGAEALEHARSRKLSDESIRRFGLGWAPDAWEALCAAARKAGYSDRQLIAAGLAAPRDNGTCYDRFRNRLIFPILDVVGKVIAFGGRAMDPADRAKYLNSPETALFDKSANLYGLNWASRKIVEAGHAIVVEGYLDALMAMQEGVENIVATLGTALTDRHVHLLSRFAEDVVLVFDADTAGRAAADRAIEMFLSQRVNVRVATLPGAEDSEVKDPCDFILAAGADAFRELLADAPDALEHAWRSRHEQYRRAPTLAGKHAVLEEFLRLIVSSVAYGAIDTLRQGLLVGHLSELLGLPAEDIGRQMRRLARRAPRASAPGGGDRASSGAPVAADRAEGWLLGILIDQPALFEQVPSSIGPEAFKDPALAPLAEIVWRLAAEDRLELPALLGADRPHAMARFRREAGLAAKLKHTNIIAVHDFGQVEGTLYYAMELIDGLSLREILREIEETGA